MASQGDRDHPPESEELAGDDLHRVPAPGTGDPRPGDLRMDPRPPVVEEEPLGGVEGEQEDLVEVLEAVVEAPFVERGETEEGPVVYVLVEPVYVRVGVVEDVVLL